MSADAVPVVVSLRQALVGAMNPDGWGYYAGKSSRLEPTCWAALALSSPADEGGDAASERCLKLLAKAQRPDGLLADGAALPPNLSFNGLAYLMLTTRSDAEAERIRQALLAALIRTKGVRFFQLPALRQNNRLRGWPWIDTTFSWVEPTAWCLFALKKTRAAKREHSAESRIAEAEQLMIDRSCAAGGWNYGNASVLDQDLRPYIPTTALGLIAMQDRRNESAVTRSWEYLQRHALSEQSAMALSLALICFRIYGGSTGPLEDALVREWTRSAYLGNLLNISMAMYSLTSEAHGTSTFRL